MAILSSSCLSLLIGLLVPGLRLSLVALLQYHPELSIQTLIGMVDYTSGWHSHFLNMGFALTDCYRGCDSFSSSTTGVFQGRELTVMALANITGFLTNSIDEESQDVRDDH